MKSYKDIKRQYLVDVILHTQGNIAHMSRITGWTARTIYYFLDADKGLKNILDLARVKQPADMPKQKSEARFPINQ